MIGFGEAGRTFAGSAHGIRQLRAFDVKSLDPTTSEEMAGAAEAAGVLLCHDHAEACEGASIVLSLVTADQAVAAAEAVGEVIAPGTVFLDLNSVAPETKRAACCAVERAGGRYVDVAVMAPVLPARLAVPLLVAGADASEAERVLTGFGFTSVRVVAGGVGSATAIKMIRSVMVKGLEALTTECFAAGHAAGVLEEVSASLDASWPGAGWASRADYNLDRMMVHGGRRAAEMEQSAATLDALGVDPAMTRGTIVRQRAIGSLGIAPPNGLAAKLAAISVDRSSSRRSDA